MDLVARREDAAYDTLWIYTLEIQYDHPEYVAICSDMDLISSDAI